MAGFSGVREAAVAGRFYPAVADALATEVAAYLDGARAALPGGRVRAIVAPHAGYSFSGATAGAAYRALGDAAAFRRAAVLAPSHRCAFEGVSVGSHAGFRTPLGTMEVDVAACEALLRRSRLMNDRADAHRSEHALEVQLPFLQTLNPDLQLVPMVCGQLNEGDLRSVAAVLAELLWRPDTLWVISSDFTHFGSAFRYTPFSDDVHQRIEELDMGAVDCIRRLDCADFGNYISETGATVCGRTPIALLLAVLEATVGEWSAELVDYTTSGRMTHDTSHSVSYAALAVLERDAEDGGTTFALTEDEQRCLLAVAREAIAADLDRREPQWPAATELSDLLRDDGCCFVTLHKAGRLRGCIGALEASEPLWRNVAANAINAAFRDPRFPRLVPGEFDEIDIEISVLSPTRPVAGPSDIEIGRHGIILSKGVHRAVYLPQVAPEQGWDLETTLDHLARKAGLAASGWRSGAAFSVFEAFVFGEEG